jgi:hypothetical protein
MKCNDVKSLFSPSLDGEVEAKQMSAMRNHLSACDDCRRQFAALQATQRMVAALGPKPAPPELALRIRVALSRELAAAQSHPFEALQMQLRNLMNAFMVPATAGTLTAVLIFGLIIGMLGPYQFVGDNDVPTMLYTPPRIANAPFGFEVGSLNGDSLVVEAYVDQHGRLQDYRIVSAPPGSSEYLPELKNLLIFTQFHPATSFGQPVSGSIVLSFSRINVKG